MEKWVRSLSKTTALLIGVVSLAILLTVFIYFTNNMSGFGLIPIAIFCGILGGGVGFTFIFFFKGITGQTPQERKESQQKK